MHRLEIGIGGTFTDFVPYDADAESATITKAPSAPSEPPTGLMSGLADMGGDPANIGMLLDGTVAGLPAPTTASPGDRTRVNTSPRRCTSALSGPKPV